MSPPNTPILPGSQPQCVRPEKWLMGNHHVDPEPWLERITKDTQDLLEKALAGEVTATDHDPDEETHLVDLTETDYDDEAETDVESDLDKKRPRGRAHEESLFVSSTRASPSEHSDEAPNKRVCMPASNHHGDGECASDPEFIAPFPVSAAASNDKVSAPSSSTVVALNTGATGRREAALQLVTQLLDLAQEESKDAGSRGVQAQLDQQLESFQQQLEGTQQLIEDRYHETRSVSSQALLRQHDVNDRFARLEQSLTAQIVDIGQGVNNKVSRLEKTFNDRVTRLQQEFNDRVTRLESRVDTLIAQGRLGGRKRKREN
ncbi:hypothetical protein FZEAL_6139 [Fusarium zealandicum]|uniref:Uncharacterized protein n=1 Tax=Fusarium zealandicum TaxID=1053134 RepID=A0A8H4UID6_9HYPO|nr:hypothetical protein FZEAL_6139 [Fusarium zealandicum]